MVIAIASGIGIGLRSAALSWDEEASVEDVQLGLVSGAAVWCVGFIFQVIFHYSFTFLSFFP